jgi:hypothetical protein
MVFHMKTTLNISDEIMRRVKEAAVRSKTTMSAYIEGALRMQLDRAEQPTELPPLPRFHSGGYLVDISDGRALRDLLDAEKDERLYGHVRVGHEHPGVLRR